MQTFPNMRRNSFNYRAVNPLYLYFAMALLYGVFSSMYYYLTPLLGLSFYYLIEHFESEEHQLQVYFVFGYVTFIETIQGLFIFSFFVFFSLFYRIALRFIKETIVCKWCLPVLYITTGYLGYMLFNLFIANIFNTDLPAIGWGLLVFILTDIFLAMFFI